LISDALTAVAPDKRQGGPQTRRRRTDLSGRPLDPPGVYEYDLPQGGLGFEIGLTGADGRWLWRRLGSVTRTQAIHAREEAVVDARRRRDGFAAAAPVGREVATRPSPTVLDLHEEWRASVSGCRPKTLAKYDAYLNHRLGDLADRSCAQLDHDDTLDWLADLRAATTRGAGRRPRPLKPATISEYAAIMTRVLRRAVDGGWVAMSDYARLVRPLREVHAPSGRQMSLTPEEIRALLAAGNDPAGTALVMLGLFCGLRIAEALGLVWGDVDLGARMLRVRYQLEVSGGRARRAPLKSAHSRRNVLLPARVAEELRPLRERSPHEEGFVVCALDGTHLRPEYARNALFYPAVERADVLTGWHRRGVDEGFEGEGLVFHHLRHTYASMMIERGTDVAYLSRQLGHRDSATTERVYRHFYDQHKHAGTARATLDAEIAALVGGR
jgi:integrase